MPQVPLNRGFRLVPETYQKDDIPLGELLLPSASSDVKTWAQLFDEYRVVILAEAGAGKTYELEGAARRLKDQGKAAFFIRIEDLSEQFEQAFEVGSAEAFLSWQASSDEGWFFLDSVDEIRLTAARVFEQALRNFAGRVGLACNRAHIYVSSRPYAWRPQRDRTLLEAILPFHADMITLEGEQEEPSVSLIADQVTAQRFTAHTNEEPLPTLNVYQMTALSAEDIRTFAECSEVPNSSTFLHELERSNLFTLAQLPFDLRDLIHAWKTDQVLGSRLNILEQSVTRQLSQAELSTPSLTLTRLQDGAQLLAIAVVLTGVANVRLQATTTGEGIDPMVLLPEWSAAELHALLTSGLFGEPVYGEVRFRHREVRELLAARWIHQQLGTDTNRNEIENWMFRSRYGLTVLSARLRPLLPWLVLFDERIRERVIAHYPEVVVEGGDAAALPLIERETTLKRVIEQITDPRASLRGLDNSAIVRIATPELEPFTLQLIEKHFEDDRVMFILGRLVWQGKMTQSLAPLSRIAADPQRGHYARLVAVRAVGCLADNERLNELWRAILDSGGEIPRTVFAELVAYAPPQKASIDLILETLARSVDYKRYDSSGLAGNLTDFVNRLAGCSESTSADDLHAFASGLLTYLQKKPHLERGECELSKAYYWLMPIALRCVEHLIAKRAPAAMSSTTLRVLAAAPELMQWHGSELGDIKGALTTLVPAWPELNDALFWRCIEDCRTRQARRNQSLKDDWLVSYSWHFWAFAADSFPRILDWVRQRPLEDDQFVALARAYRTFNDHGKPTLWREQLLATTHGHAALQETLLALLNPKPDPTLVRFQEQERKYRRQHARQQKRESNQWTHFVERLKAKPDLVRHPPGLQPSEVSNFQFHLMEHIRDASGSSTQLDGSDWSALIPEFGLAVAEAYRDAAIAFWRAYQPTLRSEGAEPNSIPAAVMFGLTGLAIELQNHEHIAKLDAREAESALRYALFELNGFPFWFDSFCRQHLPEATAFFYREIDWELSTSQPEQRSFYVLHDVVYHAPVLHSTLAPLLKQWLMNHQVLNLECLRYSRRIIGNDNLPAAEIAGLAFDKISNPATPGEQLPVWYAVRTDADPTLSLPALKTALRKLSRAAAERFGETFSVELLGGRRDAVLSIGGFNSPTYLKELYLLMHSVIRVKNDLNRAGGGVYSPTVRDDAQDARERLFGMLQEQSSEITYRAILELAEKHPVQHFCTYMRACAVSRATTDGDMQPWRIEEVAHAARRLIRTSTLLSPVLEVDNAVR
ncbi:NACHT domain-containing protein [Pseudomonas sp. SMSB3]|uniref:NACHT domain-containing protein n=1 Tax=unclassified Pseudomonas TaxID=196821 RepID=UPI003F84142B